VHLNEAKSERRRNRKETHLTHSWRKYFPTGWRLNMV
jgi:hypothetical protein